METAPRTNPPNSLGTFAFVLGGAIALVSAAVLLVLPWAAYRHLDGAYGTTLAILELVAGGVLAWTWRGHRAGRRGRRTLTFVAVCFGLLVAGSADASYRTWRHIDHGTDSGPVRLPCGPFGLLAWHWDHDALARVRAAFPGHPVRLDERCQVVGYRAPRHEVRVTVGPFRAKGVATRLLVSETVAYRPHGRVDLSPYTNDADAQADLWRFDAQTGLVAGLGHHPRLCKLELSHGGMEPGAHLACSPLASNAGGAELDRPCTDGARCLRLDTDPPPTPPRSRARPGTLKLVAPTPAGAPP